MIDQNQKSTKKEKTPLDTLAMHLALNHFNDVSIDFHPLHRSPDEQVRERELKKLKRTKERVFSEDIFEKIKDDHTAHRNILVLGAGATYDSFKNIPLAGKSITLIQKEIVVMEILNGDIEEVSGKKVKDKDTDKESIREINFDYFIKFYQFLHPDLSNVFELKPHKFRTTFYDKEINSYLLSIIDFDIHKIRERYKHQLRYLKFLNLDQFSNRENKKISKVLPGIGKRYFSEYEKLKLHSKDDRKTPIDFETSLHLLSDLFGINLIRKLITKLYDYQHGPTLFYELIAHLFKNRFFDVIINFNFDELLDQAIKDELGENGFDMILSDGDCRPLKDLSFDGKLRQPLYVKPHGTASHKSTLRFTKNQYYELPIDMRNFLEEVFDDSNDGNKKYINLVSVGFGMESLEFNDIIAKKIPREHSNIFNFYRSGSTNNKEKQKVSGLNKKYLRIFGDKKFLDRALHLIPINRKSEFDKSLASMFPLGNTFYELFCKTTDCFQEPFKPTDIDRHLIIASIFGSQEFWKEFNIKNDVHCPLQYFKSIKYLSDRISVEILLSLIANNGQIDPSYLLDAEVGKYYSMYFNAVKKYNKDAEEFNNKPGNLDKKPLENLYTISDFIGCIENFEKLSTDNRRVKPLDIIDLNLDDRKNYLALKEYIFNPPEEGCFSKELAKYLSNLSPEVKRQIIESFDRIDESHSTKIVPELRSSINHIFQEFTQSDLVTSELSLNLHLQDGLRNIRDDYNFDTICMIADHGFLLKRLIEVIIQKERIKRMFLILSWPKNLSKENSEMPSPEDYKDQIEYAKDLIFNHYKKHLEADETVEKKKRQAGLEKLRNNTFIRFRTINRHNHHMTIFLKDNQGSKPMNGEKGKAIFYYKKGLSQSINPIEINVPENVRYLLDKFDYYSKKASREFRVKASKIENFEWFKVYKENEDQQSNNK